MTTVRQQIIEKTSELLDRQGYHATGLNQIVAESETPRGSLYYYFPAGHRGQGTKSERAHATEPGN
jgi:TetR/AcrR family transcriptional repressor of lmrAB and yxaGH operons